MFRGKSHMALHPVWCPVANGLSIAPADHRSPETLCHQ